MKKYIHIIYIVVVLLAAAISPLSETQVRHLPKFVEREAEELLAEGEYIISPYDQIFRRVARRHHIDWVLLSAIAYEESRFNATVNSPRGAVGMMQVMPHIARHWDVERDELLDPAINIDVACRLYKSMQRSLRLPRTTSERDKIAFTVASYNCGASRIIDARNLAEYYDEPKYEWDTVSEYMLLLRQEEYFNHEAVVAGQFKEPHITIAYTNKVLARYDKYSAKVKAANAAKH